MSERLMPKRVSEIQLRSSKSVKRISIHLDNYDGDMGISYSSGGVLIFISEDEQRHLLEILSERFPLEAMGNI